MDEIRQVGSASDWVIADIPPAWRKLGPSPTVLMHSWPGGPSVPPSNPATVLPASNRRGS